MEGMEGFPGACEAPPDIPVSGEIAKLAEDFIVEMVAVRRVVKPPLAQVGGHDLHLENAGRGCVGLLGVLSEEGGCASPSLFAHRLGLSPARVSNILTALEREGLVERGPSDGDRRRVEVRLTDKGRATDERMKGMFVRHTAQVLAAIGEDDARELVRIMGRVVSVLEGSCPDGGKGEA